MQNSWMILLARAVSGQAAISAKAHMTWHMTAPSSQPFGTCGPLHCILAVIRHVKQCCGRSSVIACQRIRRPTANNCKSQLSQPRCPVSSTHLASLQKRPNAYKRLGYRGLEAHAMDCLATHRICDRDSHSMRHAVILCMCGGT